ncbi:non-ribosomal peptide synthetase component F (plasmid) [Ensifer sp. WSM1721]
MRRAPDAVALVHDDERLSYGELNARANRLAHHLIALGVRPDQPVAICLERSPAMVVGLLAILKAGGAYLPLDPAYPSQRLRQVLDDAAPRLLLCDAAGRAALGAEALADLSVVDLDMATSAWAELPACDPDPRALGLTSSHLAYIIYTSGSTGTPKGVMVEHRSLVNLAVAQIGLFAVGSNSRVVQFASFGFDASAWELVMAFGSGAALHLPADELRQASNRLSDYLRSEAITHATLPPVFFRETGIGNVWHHKFSFLLENCRKLDSSAVWPRPLLSMHMDLPKQQSARPFGIARLVLTGRLSRSGVRSPTRGCIFWTLMASRCRSERWVSSISAGQGWRAATSTVPS